MSTVSTVRAEQWHDAHRAAFADGFTMLEFVTGVDRGDTVELISRVVDPVTADGRMLSTIAVTSVDSITDIYAGASWHERETCEMFGVQFDGLADTRPLLLRGEFTVPPLRKSAVLIARVAREWPGAAEPDVQDGRRGGNPSRRRTRPPGVPDDFIVEVP